MNSTENIDKTIDSICNWIQKAIEVSPPGSEGGTIPETIKALAELVSARAEIGGTHQEFKINGN